MIIAIADKSNTERIPGIHDQSVSILHHHWSRPRELHGDWSRQDLPDRRAGMDRGRARRDRPKSLWRDSRHREHILVRHTLLKSILQMHLSSSAIPSPTISPYSLDHPPR